MHKLMGEIIIFHAKRIIIWIFFLLLTPVLKAEGVDSLRTVFAEASNLKEKYAILQDYTFQIVDSTEQVVLLDSVFHDILLSNDTSLVYDAILNMGRFYYNNGRLASLNDLLSRMNTVIGKKNVRPDIYYDIEAYICQANLWRGNYGAAMDSALVSYNRAREEQQEYGIICSAESLGLLYQYLRKDSDAVDVFKEGLFLLEKSEGRTGYKIQYLSNIIECLLRLDRLEEARRYIERDEKLLDEWKKEGERLNIEYPIATSSWQLNIYKADLEIRSGNAVMARTHLDKAQIYEKTETDGYVEYLSNYVKARYYKLIKNYAEALRYINIVVENDEYEETLLLKSELLELASDPAGALAVYKRLLEITNDKNEKTFTNQLNRFRSLYDLNKQELQSKEIELQDMKLEAKNKQLFLLSILLLFLIGMSYVLYRLFLHQRHLKEVIEKEKEEAERANASKSAFIANISHEIRTPMNAIVGFSQLLVADDYSEEERNLFSETIRNNSDLLLNLINDVLDLSRMEAGNMKFVIKVADLKTSVEGALRSVEHRVHPGVKLLLDCPYESFGLNTDQLRLEQLLINLLSNAAKFTEKGHIELQVRVEEEQSQVRFMVTDTGCGIAPEMQNVIFERFEKLNEYAQGTGLGLSICRLIAARLQGTIYLDANYTEGARFVFIHPIITSSTLSD